MAITRCRLSKSGPRVSLVLDWHPQTLPPDDGEAAQALRRAGVPEDWQPEEARELRATAPARLRECGVEVVLGAHLLPDLRDVFAELPTRDTPFSSRGPSTR